MSDRGGTTTDVAPTRAPRLARLRRIPSSYRLALLVFVLGSLVVAVVTQRTYRAGSDRLLDQAILAQEADLRLISEVVRPGLQTGDMASAQRLLEDLRTEGSVIALVEVHDPFGVIVAATDPDRIGERSDDDHIDPDGVLSADRLLTDGDGLIGSVHVHFDEGLALGAVTDGRREGLVIGILGIASLALVTFGAAWGFGRRLTRMTRELDETTPEGLPGQVTTTGHDEVAQMGRALNARTEAIAATMRSLSEANAALRMSEAQTNLALDASADLMLQLDLGTLDVTVLREDPGSRLLSLEEGTLGSDYIDQIHPDDEASLRGAIADHLAAPIAAFECDARLRGRDGDWRIVRFRGQATRDEVAETDLLLLTLVDITDQRGLEQQVLHADKMRTIGRMTSGIAHDFNNALAVANLNLAMLRDPSRDQSRDDEVMDRLEAAHGLAGSLVERLMRSAAPQADVRAFVDLHTVLDDLAPIFERLLGEGVELAVHKGAVRAVVGLDPARANQVLINLVGNAGDAVGGQGTVAIATRSSADTQGRPTVLLTVEDDGPGIDPAVAQTLFEPFVTTKELGVGTGLGLATALESVVAVGGTMTATNRARGGARFTVVLPLALPPSDANGNGGGGGMGRVGESAEAQAE